MTKLMECDGHKLKIIFPKKKPCHSHMDAATPRWTNGTHV